MTADVVEGVVATRFAKVVDIGLVAIVGVWHLGLDTLRVLRGWPEYEPQAAAAGAWLALTVIQTAGSVLLLRSALSGHTARMLAGAALVAGIVAAAAYPPGGAISDVSWAWNTVGWFGMLLLMQRPLWELITLLGANTAVTVGFLAADGALDHVTVSRLLAAVYVTAGIQLTFTYLVRQLNDGAREATEIAAGQAEHLARATADEAVHAERRRRYEYLRIKWNRCCVVWRNVNWTRGTPSYASAPPWRRHACGGCSWRRTTPRTRSCTNCGPVPMSPSGAAYAWPC